MPISTEAANMIQGVLALHQRSSGEVYKAYMVFGSIFISRTDNSFPRVLRRAEYRPRSGQLIRDYTEQIPIPRSSAVKSEHQAQTTITIGQSTWRMNSSLVNYEFSVAAHDENLFIAHVDDDHHDEELMLNSCRRMAGNPTLSRDGNILFLDDLYYAHATATDERSVAIFSDTIALFSWDGTCTWGRHFPEEILTYPDYHGLCIVSDYVILVSYLIQRIRVMFFDRKDGRVCKTWNLSVPKDAEESGGSISGPVTSVDGKVVIFRDPYHMVHAFPSDGSTWGRSWRAKGAEAVGRIVAKEAYRMDRDDLDGIIVVEGGCLDDLALSLVSTDDLLTTSLTESDCFEEISSPEMEELSEETEAQLLRRKQLSALHKAVAEGKEDTAARLIQNGADIQQELHSGWTVLCTAAYFGSLGLVRLLLESNALFNRPDGGLSPLDWAVRQSRVDVAKELLRHGATLGPQGIDHPPLLFIAASAGDKEMVQILLDAGSEVGEHFEGRNAIQAAEWNGDADILTLLSEYRGV